MNLSDRIRSNLVAGGHDRAIWFKEVWLPWSYLLRFSDAVGNSIRSTGTSANPRVGIVLRNTPAHLALIVGVIANHCRVVALNGLAPDDQLATDIQALGLEALVAETEDLNRERLSDAAQQIGSAVYEFSSIQRTPSIEVRRSQSAKVDYPDHEDGAIELLTSGTTGKPKRVLLTYNDLARSLKSADQQIRGQRRGDHQDREQPHHPQGVIISTPLAHIGGSWYAVKAALERRPIALLEKFDAREWAQAVNTCQARVTGLTPTAMRMVLDANIPPASLGSLRAVTSGTAPLPPSVQEEFENKYAIPVLPQYGATEFAGPVVGWSMNDYRQFRNSKIGSAGKAYPGIRLRTVDESGDLVTGDRIGILEVRRDPDDRAIWVRTTDLAEIDTDGFVWFRGRADHVINRGGFKISVDKIVGVLKSHPAIVEAAVVGLPDERLGAVPAAAVVVAHGEPMPTSNDLLRWLRSHLTPYEVPVKLAIVESLPRTISDKVSEHQVKQLLTAETA